MGNIEPIWTFEGGVSGSEYGSFGGWLGLGLISVVGGLVSGVAEALGMCPHTLFAFIYGSLH